MGVNYKNVRDLTIERCCKYSIVFDLLKLDIMQKLTHELTPN